MACLPAWKRQFYLDQLTRVNTQITALETALDSAYENAEVEEYSFNSTEGSQRTKRRSIREISQELEKLESRKMRILNKLYGHAIININLRRKR